MEKRVGQRGITLVALVVTIIIMLILAGVALNLALSDNGLFDMTKKATEEYEIASEKEYIQQNVLAVQLEEYTNNENVHKLGKSLVDINFDNSSVWDIIVENSENKPYGTGWNYLEKGNVLEDYGKTKYNWLVNYETGEVKRLEDESYKNIDYNSTISVTDHLLFNLDSASVGLSKESWGKNAKLYYYDNEKYGTIEARKQAYEEQKTYGNVTQKNAGYDRQISETISDYIDEQTGAFKFNGNNYIELKNDDGFDFSNGITIEYYGKITGQVAATVGADGNPDQSNWCGLFGLWAGNYKSGCTTRFGYTRNLMLYTLFTSSICSSYGEWSLWTSSPWNQGFNIGDIFNKDIYIFIVIDTKGDEQLTQSMYIYMDGKMQLYSGWLSKEYYEAFNQRARNLNYLELGRCNFGTDSNWGYIKGLCYSSRIYNKALSSEEVQNNYDITTKFHNDISSSKK